MSIKCHKIFGTCEAASAEAYGALGGRGPAQNTTTSKLDVLDAADTAQ